MSRTRQTPILLSFLVLIVPAVAQGQPATQSKASGAAPGPKIAGTKSDNTEKVERLSTEAAAAYNSGRYAEAAKKFQEAFSLYPEPTLLYNIARCYQGLGNYDKAIASFERFLKEPNVREALAKKARAKLKSLKEIARKSRAEAAARKARGEQSPLPRKGHRKRRAKHKKTPILAWVTLGVGSALAIGGGIAFALGASDHSSIEDAATNAQGIKQITQQEAQDLSDSGKTKKTIGVALLAAGGATLVGSAVLFLIGGKSVTEKSAQRAFNVALVPGGSVALFSGTF